jgi:hypothetical protein
MDLLQLLNAHEMGLVGFPLSSSRLIVDGIPLSAGLSGYVAWSFSGVANAMSL